MRFAVVEHLRFICSARGGIVREEATSQYRYHKCTPHQCHPCRCGEGLQNFVLSKEVQAFLHGMPKLDE